jgi:hypothetical protein
MLMLQKTAGKFRSYSLDIFESYHEIGPTYINELPQGWPQVAPREDPLSIRQGFLDPPLLLKVVPTACLAALAAYNADKLGPIVQFNRGPDRLRVGVTLELRTDLKSALCGETWPSRKLVRHGAGKQSLEKKM